MMISIFNKITECIDITNVKDFVYIAIDGPAPRAKMEQQRHRRLKSTKEKNMGYKCYYSWNTIYE